MGFGVGLKLTDIMQYAYVMKHYITAVVIVAYKV